MSTVSRAQTTAAPGMLGPLPASARAEHVALVTQAEALIAGTPGLESLTGEARRHHASALVESVHGLRLRAPERSAETVLCRWQRVVLIVIGVLLVAGLVLVPRIAVQLVVGVATLAYLAAVGFRVWLFVRGVGRPAMVQVSDEEAHAIPDAALPAYTVLVPAYREPEIVGDLVRNLEAIDYPRDKLDVKLLLEADDEETIAAARAAGTLEAVSVVLVPAMEPRTKPKACNYGLLLSDSDITTIYDAEDVPDPLQLRRAAVAFRRLGSDYACLQARLVYHNAQQNLITRWFTSEYGLWFTVLLPGMVTIDAPIPLGGTSNHIRTSVLRSAGGWDPFNVTEDADLGIRLYREGYRSAVLDSATLEEATSDAINWIKQRSRWLKGYVQTWLVHLRQPRALHRELGTAGFLSFNLMVGGTPLLSAINPLFWFLALIWLAGHPPVIENLFPAWTYYGAAISLVVGNFATVYMNIVGARLMGLNRLLVSCLLTPIYWVMMSMAAVKAMVQLVTNPSYWEKTTHGMGDVAPEQKKP